MNRRGFEFFSALSLLVTGLATTGCNDAARRALAQYEQAFSCSAADFKALEEMVHTHFSGPDTLHFADGSEAAFQVASRVNDLIADKCPARVLRECVPGHETAETYVDADFTHSMTTIAGPIEAFGVTAYSDANYDDEIVIRHSYLTQMTDGWPFRKAIMCFSRKR